jgi:hypothetical protein
MNAKINITYRDKDGSIIDNPIEGQSAYSPETKKLYVYNDGEWKMVTGETNLGITMYDLNKQIIAQMGVLEGIPREEAHLRITDMAAVSQNTYFMLLCRDINYYTLFKLDKDNSGLCNIASEVFECAEEIGAIKSAEGVEGGAVEIWVHPVDGDPVVMYLFPYDQGVVECTL